MEDRPPRPAAASTPSSSTVLGALKERDEGFRQVLSESIATQRETNQMLGRVGQALDQQTEDASRTRKVLHDTQEAIASAHRG